MASESDTIREFLVRLGFSLDQEALNKFTGAIGTATKRVVELAVALEAGAAAVVGVTTALAERMEDLYYASERTKTSATNILAFKYALGQLGGTAQQSGAILENLASFIRRTPAAEQWFKGFGVQIRDANGNLKQMDQIAAESAEAFKTMPFWLARARAGVLGIDEASLLVLERGNLKKNEEEYRELAKAWGVNADEVAKNGQKFENEVRRIKTQFEFAKTLIEGQLLQKFQPQIERLIGWLQSNGPHLAQQLVDGLQKLLGYAERMSKTFLWVLDQFVKLDEATGGWSTKILGLVAALKFLGALSIVESIAKIGGAILSAATATTVATGEVTALTAGLNGATAAASSLKFGLGAVAAVVGAGALGFTVGSWINKKLGDPAASTAAEKEGIYYAGDTPGRGGGSSTFVPTASGRGRGGGTNEIPQSDRMRQTIEFFQRAGWSASQAIGLTANLLRESGLKEGAVGDKGAAFGLAQWHKDRQAEFKRYIGHDIKGSTFEEQLRFINYELTQGKEKTAGDALRQAASARDAAIAASRYYERPGDVAGESAKRGDMAMNIQQKVDIHVTGSDNPLETAHAVSREQKQVSADMARNLRGAVIG